MIEVQNYGSTLPKYVIYVTTSTFPGLAQLHGSILTR